MPAELKWTADNPTRPGLYAWRRGWRSPGGPSDDGLLIVYAPEGTLGILRTCRPDGSHDAHIAISALVIEEWLGPLPE